MHSPIIAVTYAFLCISVKKELISKPAADSIKESGGKSNPEKYNRIIARGIVIIAEMCRLLKRESRDTWAEVWGTALTKLMDMAIQNVGDSVWNPVSNRKRDDYER